MLYILPYEVSQITLYMLSCPDFFQNQLFRTGPRSAVGNVSGYRWMPDHKSRGREFDPGPVPYFRED